MAFQVHKIAGIKFDSISPNIEQCSLVAACKWKQMCIQWEKVKWYSLVDNVYIALLWTAIHIRCYVAVGHKSVTNST